MQTAEDRTCPELYLDSELASLRGRFDAIVNGMLRDEWDLPEMLAELREILSRLSELERLHAEERRQRRHEERRRRRSLKAMLRNRC